MARGDLSCFTISCGFLLRLAFCPHALISCPLWRSCMAGQSYRRPIITTVTASVTLGCSVPGEAKRTRMPKDSHYTSPLPLFGQHTVISKVAFQDQKGSSMSFQVVMPKELKNVKIAILTCPFEPPKPKTKHKAQRRLGHGTLSIPAVSVLMRSKPGRGHMGTCTHAMHSHAFTNGHHPTQGHIYATLGVVSQGVGAPGLRFVATPVSPPPPSAHETQGRMSAGWAYFSYRK
eukprot:1159958-Pelagomonas_calceolata.AAC.12